MAAWAPTLHTCRSNLCALPDAPSALARCVRLILLFGRRLAQYSQVACDLHIVTAVMACRCGRIC